MKNADISPEGVKTLVRSLLPEIIQLRHELHKIPETGFDVNRTREKLMKALEPFCPISSPSVLSRTRRVYSRGSSIRSRTRGTCRHRRLESRLSPAPGAPLRL